LGRSGGGIRRPGFEHLLAAICQGRVGAVLAIEASRLARNGRDWHTLIEFCGFVGTIIVDFTKLDRLARDTVDILELAQEIGNKKAGMRSLAQS
jgi:DNA invertase Pin-like site-specific DNA recombinase